MLALAYSCQVPITPLFTDSALVVMQFKVDMLLKKHNDPLAHNFPSVMNDICSESWQPL